MGKTLFNKYNTSSIDEIVLIIKKELLEIYNANGKITTRLIEKDKNNKLPLIRTIEKFIKENTDIKTELTGINFIYYFLDKKIPKYQNQLSKRHKFTYKEFYNLFLNNGCILLSKEKDIKNINSKVKYICSCGNESEIKISDFKRGARCINCGIIKSSEGRKISYDRLIQIYKENGCVLLSEYKEYKNEISILKFRCKCGNIDKKSFRAFSLTPYCKKCNKSKKGKNHYCWKNGITPIHEYLRRHIYKWKIGSFNMYDNTCVLTSKKSKNVIHHVFKNFSDIMDETIKILKFEVKESINQYSEDELDKLVKECLRLHYFYGYGVCINKDIHKLFHSVYGNKNNTLQQFEEFVIRLEKNDFDDFLKRYNLKLNINYKALNNLFNKK